jgi:ATP-binding cassette subfamily F protein 3
MVPKVRNLLGAFLFHGDDVHKKVSVLSGGERNRLALAILLLKPANLLLLDEPTNHLDLASKEVLLQALKKFQGTMVFVSHDRYFVDALAGRVVEVSDRKVTSFIGNYEDFLRAKAGAGDTSHSLLRVEQGSSDRVEKGQCKSARVLSHAERKAARREEQKRKKELVEVESKIEVLEQQLGELTSEMQAPEMAVDHAKLGKLVDQHAELQARLDGCLQRWEELHEQLSEGQAS